MSVYTHRLVIIIPLASLDRANAAAAQWDPAGGGAKAFGAVQLSASGNAPATHTVCNTLCEDDLFNGLPAMSGLIFKAYDVVNGKLLVNGATAWVDYPVCVVWSGQECLADAGLEVINFASPAS